MPKRIPTAEGAALRYFRFCKGVTQAELARRAGVSRKTIDRWESGFMALARERLVEVLAFLAVPREAVEAALFADELANPPGKPSLMPVPSREARLVERAAVAGGSAGVKVARVKINADLRLVQAPAHRRWAGKRWSHLKGLTATDQEWVVDGLLGDNRSWALAERICLASTTAAANRAEEALRLARLAVRIAEHVPGADWRLGLLG